MEPQHEERRLTTILSADVVGYSRLMAADEEGTLAQLKAHRKELIKPKTAEHQGRVIKLMDGGTLMEFDSAVDALNFAIDVQRAMAERNSAVPDDNRVTYRIGINVGDIIVDGDDIYGDGVKVAARLQELADPGGIWVSGTVFDHVKGKVDLAFEDLGEQEVKNIPEPIRVYRVPISIGRMQRHLSSIFRNWFPFALFLFFLVPVIMGEIGHAFGLPHLFRDDPQLREGGLFWLRSSPAVWGHAGASLLLIAIWTGIFVRQEMRGEHAQVTLNTFAVYLVRNAWPFLTLLPLAAAYPAARQFDWGGSLWQIVESGFGIVFAIMLVGTSGIAAYLLILWLSPTALGRFFVRVNWIQGLWTNPENRSILILALYLGCIGFITFWFTVWNVIQPSAALCVVLVWVVMGYFIFAVIKPAWRFPVTVVLVLFFLLFGNDAYHNRFPGFDVKMAPTYEEGQLFQIPATGAKPATIQWTGLDAEDTLDAWRHYVVSGGDGRVCKSEDDAAPAPDSAQPPDGAKPKLIVVAVSGGAYRAGFWSAKVLDRLIELSQRGEALEGLTSHIRLLTGASGGMVASAYFSALSPDPCLPPKEPRPKIEDRLRANIMASRSKDANASGKFKTSYPIDRDGLGPVAQQMLQRDIPRYVLSPLAYVLGLRDALYSWRRWDDRGTVLEQQWGALEPTFKDLEPGERLGWRPSLIFSPMMVETGQPLLISNLDLSKLTAGSEDGRSAPVGTAVEFFQWFPNVHDDFRVQTAARMNASFPYVSPAVSLPTTPPRRVVDAGYYDNFGVSLSVSWLSQKRVIDWLKDYTSGVFIIQIRAYPTNPPDKDVGDFWRRLGEISQWLTSPIEGAAAARSAGMVFRNDEEIKILKARFEPGFVKSYVFENRASDEDVGMSWYIRCEALRHMDEQLTENQQVFDRLDQDWNAGSAPKTMMGEDGEPSRGATDICLANDPE